MQEALSLLHNKKQKAKVLAGGIDLIAQMRAGRVQPASIIDIKNIPELNLGGIVILTLACGKYRFNDHNIGQFGGLPRRLDILRRWLKEINGYRQGDHRDCDASGYLIHQFGVSGAIFYLWSDCEPY